MGRRDLCTGRRASDHFLNLCVSLDMGRGKLGATSSDETVSQHEVDLLRSRLEASELKHRVNELTQIVATLQVELKESNTLLLKSRKLCPRPHLSSVQKQLVAARQHWVCSSAEGCPLRNLTPNHTFDSSLYIVDHIRPYSASGKHSNNLQALCIHCESCKTRKEVMSGAYRRADPASSDDENEDEVEEDQR